MAGKRVAKLNEQFRREITGILRTEVRDPRIGVPTVTAVDVTSDLWLARIYVRPDPVLLAPDSALAGDEASRSLLEGLTQAMPFIRRELGRRLPIRRVPELRFEVDKSLEHAVRIESLLRSVRPVEAPDLEPSDPADQT
jgi:ribosome-binding factor A